MRILCFILCFFTVSVSAQDCVRTMLATTPDSSFVDNEDGTVTDVVTGLMWMQCSVGQTWVDGACTGDASELNWQEALVFAHGYQFANKTGWRVPNIKELATITERSCVRPASNETLFPNSRNDDYWTSSPSVTDTDRAWVISFDNSSNSLKDKSLFVFTRLVRNAD